MFKKLAAVGVIGMLIVSTGSSVLAQDDSAMVAPYTLPDLPYAYDALEGAIDTQTMKIHHGKHHAGYVAKLNAALAENADLAEVPLEELLADASELSAALRNNGGGHYNHSQFWTIMAPEGEGGEPSAELLAAIEESFGSLDDFKAAFNMAATSRFGSGWAWLVETDDGLAITTTPNQDNPLMDVAPLQGTPLLGVDVWEHAYYLQYQNRRGDYLSSWWDVVNWNELNKRYADAS